MISGVARGWLGNQASDSHRATATRAAKKEYLPFSAAAVERPEGSNKGGAMQSRTEVMVWGMVMVLICIIAIDIVRTQV
jgi:hypothetical protein